MMIAPSTKSSKSWRATGSTGERAVYRKGGPESARFGRNQKVVSLVKSKQRVADHGEVFTPPWLVEAMLDMVGYETQRIDARFLEPACGTGNFIVQILQ